MGQSDLLRDEETQPQSVGFFRFGVAPAERVENSGQELRRDTASIADADGDVSLRAIDLDRDARAGLAMVKRVADQVREHLQQAIRVSGRPRDALRLDEYIPLRMSAAELVDRSLHELCDVDRLAGA